jgi:hypothetical protein
MKVALTFGAWLAIGSTAFGQGQFLFSTYDPSAGNDVRFENLGIPISGPGWFVEVSAGPDAEHLQRVIGTLNGPLALNRTGAGAGYTNPFSDIFTVPGRRAGESVTVGYIAYHGSSLGSGLPTTDASTGLIFAQSQVVLAEPPTPPNEVYLGVVVVNLVPEPPTEALVLLASALFMTARRCKRSVRQV